MNRNDTINGIEVTRDALFGSHLELLQPRQGYRFSQDSLLLASFACESIPYGPSVDLGCGCGVVGLSLLLRDKVPSLTGIEIQPDLATLASKNARVNGFEDRVTILNQNMKDVFPAVQEQFFHSVVCNPPFWTADSGKLSTDRSKLVARHEIEIDIRGVLKTAKRLLHPSKGRLYIVFSAGRMPELAHQAMKAGFCATRSRNVHPQQNLPAETVLFEFCPGRNTQTIVEPPFIINDINGCATEDTRLLHQL